MWQAKHEQSCKDQSRYETVRERVATEDADGNVLDADPHDGEIISAQCAECGAKADWVD